MNLALEHEVFGRGRELAQLSSFLALATPGSGLLVEGEAGIGKTVLWRAALEMARQRSFRILACEPVAAETVFSYAALGDLIGDVFPSILDELPRPQRRALKAALLVGGSEASPPEDRVVALALLSALRLLAERGPVLVAVDDAQWLDRPSATALAFATRRLGTEPVLGLFSVRREVGVPPLELERVLGERLLRLPVGALTIAALHRVVVSTLGQPLSRPALVRVREVSGGNPFFALEIARSLLERADGLEPGPELRLPIRLEELVRARLERLPRPVRQALEPAALSAEPTVPLLEEASAEPGRVGDRLDRAVAAGVIKLDEEAIRFAHPLLASVLASLIGSRRRRELHRRLAALARNTEERARHLALSTSQADGEIADEVEAGAREAAGRGASVAAGELLERAAALTPDTQRAQRWRRTVEAARAYLAAGIPRHGIELLERLLTEIPRGRDRADALLALAQMRGDSFEEADELLEQALFEAEVDPVRISTINSARALICFIRTGNVAAALTHAEVALAAAERTREPALIVAASARVASLETWAGRISAGVLERAFELEQDEGLTLEYTESPRVALGLRLMYADRLDAGRRLLEGALDAAAARGDDYERANLLFHIAELECRAGDFLAAAAAADECWTLQEQQGMQWQGGTSLYVKGLAAAHLGRVEEARAAAEQGLAISLEIGDEIFRVQNLAVLGFLELLLGNIAEAVAMLRPLPAWLVEHEWYEPSVCPAWPNAIEALASVGEHDLAREYLELFQERAAGCDCPWALATAARCRGLLLAVEGELEEAFAAFADALHQHARTPGRFERARTVLALGTTRRRAKQKRLAREALTEAATIFDGLAAPLWAEKARAELRRIPGRTPAPAGLTESERRVAELVAEGRSNREVAAELFLTERTVEWNLSKVYSKLGVRSRTGLTRKLALERRP
jgi:DNA-binding CsgD family transcriptional regulator/tetratricopeptide (TPR) repeat protein